MAEVRNRLLSYRLTTAEITYHLPDYPSLLQHFIWQDHDLAPHFPALRRFLTFWSRSLEGPLHSVKIEAASLIRPAEFRFANGEFVLH
ncbi:MAG: Usg family protein [Rhodospirillales bacterium]|nr:Usg family protein [Rhodospirillales bacterium]